MKKYYLFPLAIVLISVFYLNQDYTTTPARTPASTFSQSCYKSLSTLAFRTQNIFQKTIFRYKKAVNANLKETAKGKTLYDFSDQLIQARKFGIDKRDFEELFELEVPKRYLNISEYDELYDEIYLQGKKSAEDVHKKLLKFSKTTDPQDIDAHLTLVDYIKELKFKSLPRDQIISQLKGLPLVKDLSLTNTQLDILIQYVRKQDGPASINKSADEIVYDFYLNIFSKKEALELYNAFNDGTIPSELETIMKYIAPRGPPEDKALVKKYLLTRVHKSNQPKLLQNTPSTRFVFGNPANPISFGLEIEVIPSKVSNIFDYYKPSLYETTEWIELSIDKRLEIVERIIRNVKAKDISLENFRTEKIHPLMPKKLLVEPHGTIEFSGIVHENLDVIKDFINTFSTKFGPGSYQGHVVYKQDPNIDGLVGYGLFESDYAQLMALEQGAVRNIVNSQSIPGNNIIHHSLGPLNERNREQYLALEKNFKEGGELKNIFQGRMQYGPALRADVYPQNHIGHELRQYHDRIDELTYAMDIYSRELHHFGTLGKYKKFENTTLITDELHIDRALEYDMDIDDKRWNSFFQVIERHIKKKYLKDQGMYGAAPIRERFYYPLRDWKSHPIFENLDETDRAQAFKRIDEATITYMKRLEEITQSKSDLDLAENELRVAMAKWAHEVDLSKYFESFRYNNLNHTSKRKWKGYVAGNDPVINFSEYDGYKKFKSGASVKVLNKQSQQSDSSTYKRMIKNSVEVIYRDIEPFGHIDFRVGEKIYSFNTVKNTKNKSFSPIWDDSKKRTGYVYLLDASEIEKMQDDLDLFYRSSEQNNVPPFDSWSSRLNIIEKGRFRKSLIFESTADSDNPQWANHAEIDGKIIEKDGRYFIKSKIGYEHEVFKQDGKYYTNSYSCATSAIHQLKKLFNIEHSMYHGAKSFRDSIEKKGLDGRAPDFYIDY